MILLREEVHAELPATVSVPDDIDDIGGTEPARAGTACPARRRLVKRQGVVHDVDRDSFDVNYGIGIIEVGMDENGA